jgi:tetratricopeptide (TPR) repeat protein
MLTSSFRNGGADVTVIQMLNAAEPGIEKSWKGDPLAEAALRSSLGASYVTLSQPDRARPQLERALALYQSLGRYSDGADTLLVLGINAQGPEGRMVAAADYYQRALEALKRAGKDASPALSFRVKVYLAGVLISAHRLPDARALLDEAIGLADRDSTIPRAQLPAAWTHQGEICVEEARFDQGEALFHRAIAADPNTSDAWLGLARSSFLKQNFTAAAKFAHQNYDLEASYNREHIADAAEAEGEWARYRADIGEAEPAVAQIRNALPDLRKDYLDGFMLARYLQIAAHVYEKAGRFDEAAQFARQSLDAFHHAQLPELHPLAAASLEDLGNSLAGLKRYHDAIPALDKALAIDRQLGPAYHSSADHIASILNEVRSADRVRLPAAPLHH